MYTYDHRIPYIHKISTDIQIFISVDRPGDLAQCRRLLRGETQTDPLGAWDCRNKDIVGILFS